MEETFNFLSKTHALKRKLDSVGLDAVVDNLRGLTEEEAERDPRRSMITRALGLEPDLDVDLYPVALEPGDRALICSDGLTTMVREDEIETILAGEREPDAAAQRLIEAANAAGGVDNTTVLVLDAVEATDDARDGGTGKRRRGIFRRR